MTDDPTPHMHGHDMSWLDRGGEAGRLIRAFDWSTTELGPLDQWPQSLRTVTGMLLLSPLPMALLWGVPGIMIYNDAYAVIAGRRHPQLIGSEVRKGWPEVADFNDNVMRVGLAGGTLAYKDQPLTLERNGSPETVWLDLDYSPVLDESGRPAGVIAVVVETTERIRGAERIRENEARLQFLDALREATTRDTDADGILATTTQLLGRHMDVSVCAYADMDDDEDGFTIRGEWADSGSRSILGHYRLGSFGSLAVRNLRSGKPFIVDDHRSELPPPEAQAFLDLGVAATICMPLIRRGRLTALMAVHHREPRQWRAEELALLTEVTERSWAHIEHVRAEAQVREGERRFREHLERMVAERTAALERSEANLRTIFETSHLCQWLLGTDGTVLYANATAMAGIDAILDDVIGTPYWLSPWFARTPGMPDTIEAALRRTAGGSSENMALALNLPGGLRSFDFSVRPVVNEAGEVTAMVPEAIDNTARVKAEQTLLQVQKMEALGNLTGGIAHDFNNLLMAVHGSLDLLRERMPQEPLLLRLVDNAMAGAERGSGLTRRMLAFARRQDLKTENLDLRGLVEGMTDLMRRALGPTVTIETHFAPNLPATQADANQLEAALLNLAVNARDAMDGAGTLVIATDEAWVQSGHDVLMPGHYVRLSLSDSGSGMDARTLTRAIEPFFTTKGVGKGTGLGLSMVHGLAEQLGGALVLHSRVDEGTTAEVWLPASPLPASTASRPTASDAPADVERCHAEGAVVVLTVDDDDLVRTTTVEMLEALGYDVVAARSGAEALQLLERTCVDLVITDHAMPQMTGAQLAGQIRERWPDLPVIMATGYAELPTGSRLDLPRLAKPYTQASLADAVARSVPRQG